MTEYVIFVGGVPVWAPAVSGTSVAEWLRQARNVTGVFNSDDGRWVVISHKGVQDDVLTVLYAC